MSAMWRRYLRFWRPDPDADLDEEIRFHFETEIDALVESGLDADAARREALRRFGDVERFRDDCRRADASLARSHRWAAWRSARAQDVRLAWRGLRGSPGFAAAAVLTIAFGVGVNTSLFSLLYAVTMRPLPVAEAERVVSVYERFSGDYSREVRGTPYLASVPEFEAFRAAARALDGLAAYAEITVPFGAAGGTTVANAQLASCDYFRVMRVAMARGRAPTADECLTARGAPVAVLSHGLWTRELGGDPGVLGRTITVAGRQVTVVGIAPRGFGGVALTPADLWLPLAAQPDFLGDRDFARLADLSWLSLVGRVADGRTFDDVRRDLAAAARAADAEHPGRRTEVTVQRASLLGGPEAADEGGPALVVVVALGGLVVVIACANVMNLLLARAAPRRAEIALRVALGASRRRLVAQLMTESALLAVCGGALGLLLAAWAPPLVLSRLDGVPPSLDLTPDARIFAYAFGVSLLTALGFGLVPALDATSPRVSAAMRRSGRVRDVVVGLQFALSVAFLVTAGLFARGLGRARDVDPGFTVDRLLVVSLWLPGGDRTAARPLYDELERQVAGLPGVRSVARAQLAPLDGRGVTTITLGTTVRDAPIATNLVSSRYFATLGVPLVAGRTWDDADVGPGRPRPVVVSAATAARYWPGRSAVGERFRADGVENVVSGVARDARNETLAHVDPSFFYAAASPDAPAGMLLFVRADGALGPTATAVRARARALDANVAVTTTTFRERVDRTLTPQRLTAALTAAVGLLAVTLAMVGVYGVVSYAVARRAREIGVRVAIGASPARVVGVVLRGGARVVLGGAVAGLLAAAAAAQGFRSALLGVGALDPVTYVGAALLVAAAAVAAMARPAHRAARIDPATALRQD